VRGVAWWWCAGTFLTSFGGHRVTRNVDSGYFNVYKSHGKWVGVVEARGAKLRTWYHAEAWRAAVELEWVLGLWCAKHGEWRYAAALWCVRHGCWAGVRGWCAGVPRGELVSNLPQLQAEGRVGSDGGLAEAMEVDREPELPAPRAPKSTVRAAVGCGRQCAACGCTTDQCVRRCLWSGWTWAWRWTSRCTSRMRRRAWRVSGCVAATLLCVCSCSCLRACCLRVRSAVPGAALHQGDHGSSNVGLPVQRALHVQHATVAWADQAAGCACQH